MIDELASALRLDPAGPAIVAVTRAGRVGTRLTRGELAKLADEYAAALLNRSGLRLLPGSNGSRSNEAR